MGRTDSTITKKAPRLEAECTCREMKLFEEIGALAKVEDRLGRKIVTLGHRRLEPWMLEKTAGVLGRVPRRTQRTQWSSREKEEGPGLRFQITLGRRGWELMGGGAAPGKEEIQGDGTRR